MYDLVARYGPQSAALCANRSKSARTICHLPFRRISDDWIARGNSRQRFRRTYVRNFRDTGGTRAENFAVSNVNRVDTTLSRSYPLVRRIVSSVTRVYPSSFTRRVPARELEKRYWNAIDARSAFFFFFFFTFPFSRARTSRGTLASTFGFWSFHELAAGWRGEEEEESREKAL